MLAVNLVSENIEAQYTGHVNVPIIYEQLVYLVTKCTLGAV